MIKSLQKLFKGNTPTKRLLEPHHSLSPHRTVAHDFAINSKLLITAAKKEAEAVHQLATTSQTTQQSTWWYDPNTQPPRFAIEKIIQTLSEQYVKATNCNNESELIVTGAEWWIQHRTSITPQFFHFDTDVGRHSSTVDPIIRCPSLSSIFYLTNTGGPTVVLAQRPTTNTWFNQLELIPPEATECDIMYPRINRYMLFRGDMLHGVLPSDDDQEMRTTLLINWWVNEKPSSPNCSNPTKELLHCLQDVQDIHQDVQGEWDQKETLSNISTPIHIEETDLQTGGSVFGTGSVPCVKLSFDVDLSVDDESDGSKTTSAYFPTSLLQKSDDDEDELLENRSDIGHRIVGMGRLRLIENQFA